MPLKSRFQDVEIPNVDIPTFLFDRKPEFGDEHPVLIEANSGKYLTFNKVREYARRFGAGLQDSWNWKKNDVFCIFSTNRYDYTVVAWGIHFALGIVTPSNPSYQVGELVHQLLDSNAKAIIALPTLLPLVCEAASKAGIPRNRIVVFGDKNVDGFESWKSLFSVRWADYPGNKIDSTRDVAFLAYSSGTTGLPKGVMLSHRNIIANTLQSIGLEGGNLTSKDRYMACLPFFHIYGLTAMGHVGIYRGIGLVVLERFDLSLFCQAVQNGAAPLTKELVLETYGRLGIPVKQGYGLTETSPTTHAQTWEGVNSWRVYGGYFMGKANAGSIGPLLPNLEAKLINEQGDEAQEGELWVRGPNVMLGYLNNPEANSQSLTNDGFFKTGDIGRVDQNGNFYITDRIKELIKYKGFQVAPAELEGLLVSHPKVGDAGVVGVYADSVASELPLAFIVPSPGIEPSDSLAEELILYVQDRVAPHKRLRGGVRFVKVIPKSPSGKILRRILKSQIKKSKL